MQYVPGGIAALALVILVILVAIALRRPRAGGCRGSAGAAGINIILLLREAVEPDIAGLTAALATQWEPTLRCEEDPSLADPAHHARCLRISGDAGSLLLTLSATPLPAPVIELFAGSASLDAEQEAGLRAHRGTAVIHLVQSAGGAVARARLAAQVLLTLMKWDSALGYAIVAAQQYWPRDVVEEFAARRSRTSFELFLLLAGAHRMQLSDGRYWYHTHGMEQFGLPDIETKYADGAQHDYYRAVGGNCALSGIDSGIALKRGRAAAMNIDGVAYAVAPVRKDERCHFGPFGAIELIRREAPADR